MSHLPSGFQWPPTSKAIYASEIGLSSNNFPETVNFGNKVYAKSGPVYPMSQNATPAAANTQVIPEENKIAIGYAYSDTSLVHPTIADGGILFIFSDPFVA